MKGGLRNSWSVPLSGRGLDCSPLGLSGIYIPNPRGTHKSAFMQYRAWNTYTVVHRFSRGGFNEGFLGAALMRHNRVVQFGESPRMLEKGKILYFRLFNKEKNRL